ncbi:MAG: hypothetical protein K8I02_09285, partial [Candidatus Methylomirabilis sp.]|nr:hypothetical protein [Deltaproteobacteria bacterium]
MTRPERVLRVQAAIFALVVIALEGWAIVAIQPTHASHEPAIRELARIVAEVDAAALAPEDFADSGSDADRARAARAFT